LKLAENGAHLNTEHMVSYSLTDRQREILQYLASTHARTGLVASVRELQAHFGFSSSNSVTTHLRALEKKGFIRRVEGKARSILFTGTMPVQNLPELSGKGAIQEPLHDTLTIPLPFVDSPTSGDGSRSAWDKLPEGLHLDSLATLFHGDALDVMAAMKPQSVHAIVTDPPYGLIEYEDRDHAKLRSGKGGVWRIPPKLDGVERAPLPRFTVLGAEDLRRLSEFFRLFAVQAMRVLVPGGHVILAANPLLSTLAFAAIAESGLEKRGEIIRLVTTLRGGDRPKGAEEEFQEVSVMPRSCWEPWGLFRKPISEKTVSQNLRRWGTGALRRPSVEEPLKDVIECSPARGKERQAAPHPSLKPQKLMRMLVRASLPLGKGTVLDPFAGSASTLAAASAVGYRSIGIERDPEYLELARNAFETLKSVEGLVRARGE